MELGHVVAGSCSGVVDWLLLGIISKSKTRFGLSSGLSKSGAKIRTSNSISTCSTFYSFSSCHKDLGNRKFFENYLIRRPFESSVEMATFVSEQVALLHSLLLLEYADGNLDEAELLLLVAGVEEDAKRRLLLPLQVIE